MEKMSAVTQFLLLYFIYQKKCEEKSQSELAKYLNISAMNVSRAVKELQELGLVETHKEGTNKFVRAVAIGKKLYQLSNRFLQSPVQRKIYVSLKYFDMALPYAGETALAKRSILNYPKCTVFAMDKKLLKNIPKEAIIEPKFITTNDYVEIDF